MYLIVSNRSEDVVLAKRHARVAPMTEEWKVLQLKSCDNARDVEMVFL